MSTSTPTLFPMFLKLGGRRCVVVGGGLVAESKIDSLLTSGGIVTVISPTLTSSLKRHEQQESFMWIARRFESADLDGAFLVIAATSEDATNELVFREAERRGILCNAVDQPPRCHFYFPAVVRRGALQIAISTAGLSPSLAQRLRKQFEVEFAPEYGEWLLWLGVVRDALMQRGLDFGTRKRLLAYITRHESFERWRASRDHERVLQEVA
jgi:precorrin-2 dehydrogenase / sirohydrochlorin ferrochelatase